eukprot:11223804-Lingulodinium_polyedra.AAC.1
MRHARARRARAISWSARGACVRGACRRVEAAKRAFDRIVTELVFERCAAMRSNSRFVGLSRRNAPR